jgi:N-acetyl-anhydromuramyl-L-alanine amidase AmpD
MNWNNLKPIDLSKIETVEFPKDQYVKESVSKTQIVLHHTVSGDGINGDVTTWENNKERVATCIIVDRGGIPWQLFSSKYWAWHLGAGNTNLDMHSIAIEIDNWGWLTPDGNKFKNAYGQSINAVTQYYPNKFRDYNYYEKYTDAQIQTVGELILYWHTVYNIPLDYHEDMWEISQNALSGKPGIWTHVSFRKDKSDCHPQPELIDMLKTLNKI